MTFKSGVRQYFASLQTHIKGLIYAQGFIKFLRKAYIPQAQGFYFLIFFFIPYLSLLFKAQTFYSDFKLLVIIYIHMQLIDLKIRSLKSPFYVILKMDGLKTHESCRGFGQGMLQNTCTRYIAQAYMATVWIYVLNYII